MTMDERTSCWGTGHSDPTREPLRQQNDPIFSPHDTYTETSMMIQQCDEDGVERNIRRYFCAAESTAE